VRANHKEVGGWGKGTCMVKIWEGGGDGRSLWGRVAVGEGYLSVVFEGGGPMLTQR